jgi:hypothetical protein
MLFVNMHSLLLLPKDSIGDFCISPQKGSIQDQQGDLMGGAKGIAPLADLLPISGPCSLNAVLKAAGKIEEMLQGRSRPKKKKPQVPS